MTPTLNSYIRWPGGEILKIIEIGVSGSGKAILVYDPAPIFKNIIGNTLDIPYLHSIPFKTLEPHEIIAAKLEGIIWV